MRRTNMIKSRPTLIVLAVCFIIAVVCKTAVAADALPASIEDNEKVKITLEVVEVYDTRLPTLSETDVRQILDEAKRTFSAKLGAGSVEIEFHDNGGVTFADLFNKETKSRTKSDTYYQYLKPWKYNLELGDKMVLTDDYREEIIKFLHQWDLESLKNFFPDAKIETYDDVYVNLMSTYHSRIKWLKTLKTPGGENLVIIPPAPYQSEVEWVGMMGAQDKYDVIITNSLIIKDNMQGPYPHAICKYAKLGGESFYNRYRGNMNGRSVMVNTLEEFGEVPGITPPYSGDISREMKDKIIGGFILTHEIGHAIFNLTDVYDHGDSCLMNSSKANEDRLAGYLSLTKDEKPCLKCLPKIKNQTYLLMGYQKEREKLFNDAAELYMLVAEDPIFKDTEKYGKYVDTLYGYACKAFTFAGNSKGKKASCKK